jgi:hypothetical protein
MRGKDFNTGLRGVLFEARHFDRMGSAIWLYGWLVLRQTHESGGFGWVLGGSPITYREVEEETGFNRRTLERWMGALRRERYIETEVTPGGLVVRIAKPKKFSHPPRGFAEGVRKVAERATQDCLSKERNVHWNHEHAEPIRSSSVGEKNQRNDFNRDFHKHGKQSSNFRRYSETDLSTTPANPSCLDQTQRHKPKAQAPSPNANQSPQLYGFVQESRARLQLLRAEREDAVRRELAVGAGPEVPRQ